jgi:UrcA family protein
MNSRLPILVRPRMSSVAVAALLLAAVAPNAFAANTNDSPGDSVSRIVRFGDLNLNTEEGARTLYHRIQGAAGRVCREATGRDGISWYWKCYENAVANAVNKVNNSHLTAMYQEKLGRKSAG